MISCFISSIYWLWVKYIFSFAVWVIFLSCSSRILCDCCLHYTCVSLSPSVLKSMCSLFSVVNVVWVTMCFPSVIFFQGSGFWDWYQFSRVIKSKLSSACLLWLSLGPKPVTSVSTHSCFIPCHSVKQGPVSYHPHKHKPSPVPIFSLAVMWPLFAVVNLLISSVD